MAELYEKRSPFDIPTFHRSLIFFPLSTVLRANSGRFLDPGLFLTRSLASVGVSGVGR
jgi:hypothetical protein